MYRTVREFLNALESAGELKRIVTSVSPVLEIAAITDRVSKGPAPNPPSRSARRTDPLFHDRGGPALLFEQVQGSDIPVLINTYGSYRRMEMALGCADESRGVLDSQMEGGFEAIAARIGALARPEPPRSFREAIARLRQFAPLARIGPKRVRAGRCQEVIWKGEHVDLNRLPILRCWPLDGDLAALGYPEDINAGIPGVEHDNEQIRGRYITLGGIHTIHADDAGVARPASHNIGMYRVQQLGRRHMAMHWHMHHDGAAHWRSWKRKGERMPVAIALGGESVLPYAATAPLPPGISELLMAGFLNGGGIPMVKARTVPLWVPANAEIIIEGYVSDRAGPIGFDPRSAREPLGEGAVFEGPFGDHTGFYSWPDRYPILEVTAVTHAHDAVYPTTIVGLPPQEDYYLGKATERLFLPLLKVLIPDIEDYDLPRFGAFHNCAFIRINKQYPLHARRVMHAIWGAGQMAWTKNIFVVDHDVDVHDFRAVLRAAARSCLPSRDLEIVNGPLDILDHAAPRLGAGGKLGFDCTHKIAGEEVNGVPVLPADETKQDFAIEVSETQAAAYLERIRSIEHVTKAALPGSLGSRWLLIAVRGAGSGMIDEIIEQVWRISMPDDSRHGAAPAPLFIVLVDESVDVDDEELTLFHWCANCDVTRDGVRNQGRIAFDATIKSRSDSLRGLPVRDWPPLIQMDEKTLARVESRWNDYGIVMSSGRAG